MESEAFEREPFRDLRLRRQAALDQISADLERAGEESKTYQSLQMLKDANEMALGSVDLLERVRLEFDRTQRHALAEGKPLDPWLSYLSGQIQATATVLYDSSINAVRILEEYRRYLESEG